MLRQSFGRPSYSSTVYTKDFLEYQLMITSPPPIGLLTPVEAVNVRTMRVLLV